MARQGWDATGRLEPLWADLDPPTADTLADLAGVHVKTIYSANSGDKPLGYKAGGKIAAACGLTIYDIGAPKPYPRDFALSLLGQIVKEVESRSSETPPELLAEFVTELRGLADALEAVATARAEDDPPA